MEIYTRYTPNPTEKKPAGDAAWIKEGWLEETHLKLDETTLQQISEIDPAALRDSDQDGYWEVREDLLDKITDTPARPFPLATYFEEKGECSSETRRLKGLSPKLWVATKNYDFTAARDYFTEKAEGSSNPLKNRVLTHLSQHLKATAKHMDGDADDSIMLEGPTGFSVRYDGRLRFDCALFAQLAHSDLKGIPDLEFHYIRLVSQKPPKHFDHVVFLVSDLKRPGRYLLVDNDTVTYLESRNIWATIKRLYSDYVGFKRSAIVDGEKAHF